MEATANQPKLELAASPREVKLDLGCGQNPREGFEGVDLNAPNAQHRFDLFKFPWPIEDSSVDELHCSHFIEHVPARDLIASDVIEGADLDRWVGQDMLFAFFDECYRILKPGAWMTVIWPALRSNRAFQDPTHRRFIPEATMCYLSAEWRKMNGLDHYRVSCNFTGDVGYTTPIEIGAFCPEAQARYVTNFWNVTIDFNAKLKSLKPAL